MLGNIYKPPKSNNNLENVNQFLSELEPILADLVNCNNEIIVSGDFNLDLLKLHNRLTSANFIQKMLSYGLMPKITLPTRIGTHSATLIDNIFCKFTKNTINTDSGIIYSSISDHFPVFLSLDGVSKKSSSPHRPKFINICKLTESNLSAMSNALVSEDIYSKLDHSQSANANENYEILHQHLTSIRNKYISYKRIRFNKYKHKASPWITNGIIKSLKYKDTLYRSLSGKAINTPDYLAAKQNLTVYRSILKKLIRDAKSRYYNNLFYKHKNDLQQTWRTISDVLCKANRKSCSIKKIVKNDKIYSDNQSIANLFNNFFVGIGPSLSAKIDTRNKVPYERYLKQRILTSFKFTLISEDCTSKIINSLNTKNSSGHDGISVRVLKRLSPALIKPLTLIINQSFLTGNFPDKLKIARVVPLFKKGDDTDVNNYRPISLLTAISKIFEKAGFLQIYNYFHSNKLFHKGQYGFLPQRSTELAALEFIDRISLEFEKKLNPFTLFMDLSKAFDTLDHNILLHKLQYYGIEGTSLQWFASYLSNRKQYVDINNTKSDYATLTTGVPQGSILGPLLFLIYVNDITYSSEYFTFILYADDTTLFSSLKLRPHNSETVRNFEQKTNDELSKVNNWLAVNKLT
jgi:hypothetical protein